MNNEELINRAFDALNRNVKIIYPGQERNEITLWLSDDSFFGFIKGSRNFEIKLSRDIDDSKNYLLATVTLLNDNTKVEKRCHTSYIIPKLRHNKNFSVDSLYSRGIIGSDQDFIFDNIDA